MPNAPVCRKLSGEQRALLYILAANSGLRASECAALRKKDFCQQSNTVSIAGDKTKNGKAATIPLPAFVWEAFAPYLATLADEGLLWPGGWADGKEGAVLLRADADRTEPPIIIGKAGIAVYGFAVDFHALRHYYCSQVDRAGVSERLARKLARASSGALLDRYTHREQSELAAAVAGFPPITTCTDLPPKYGVASTG